MEQETYTLDNETFLASAAKTMLSLSLGSVVRTVLGGFDDGRRSLRRTYTAVSPFSPLKDGKGLKLLHQIPVVGLESVAPLPERLTLDLRFVNADGATPFRDVLAILSLAVAQQPEAALEFGTFHGSTTASLALNLPEAHIHTLDLPEETTEAAAAVDGKDIDDQHLVQQRQLGKCFRGTPLAGRITQHTGDTANFDYASIPGNLSFFLIDGCHTYEYAKSDTLHSFAAGKGLCTFVWHDCDTFHAGVTAWLVELIAAGLPVQHIENTSVACLRIDPADPRVRALLTTIH